MKFQRRAGAKIQMKCHQCKEGCQPKNGDWHDGPDGQIFLCRSCESAAQNARPKLFVPVAMASVSQVTA